MTWNILPRNSFIEDRYTHERTEVVAMSVGESRVTIVDRITPVSFLTPELEVVTVQTPHTMRLTIGEEI